MLKQKQINMKKLLIVLVLAVMATGAFAQAKKAQPHQPVKKAIVKEQASTIYYTVQEGKVVIMNGETMSSIDGESVKFPNGNILLVEGTLIYDNGTKKVMLAPGERVDMKGIKLASKSNDTSTGEDAPEKK